LLEKRGYSVFLDVNGLNSGKFGSKIKQMIKQATYFILILTKASLDLCKGDTKNQDWIHNEVVYAFNAKCQIIPIFEPGFTWPHAEQLPSDMRKISQYNGIKWVHEYQEACAEKLERSVRLLRHTREYKYSIISSQFHDRCYHDTRVQ
jgi:TIR domain